MYYGNIKKYDIADGTGVRISLFVSGCRNACEGCFNQVSWNFKYGKEFTDETLAEIIDLLKPEYVEGFSILGGEPFEEENQETVLHILQKVKEAYPNKNIWAWTGYTLETDLLLLNGKKHTPFTNDILKLIDVLVDGRFILSKRNLLLKWKGSENQRVIDLKQTLISNKIVLK